MNKKLMQLMTALIFLVLATGVRAAEQGKMEHGAMAGMEHSGMSMAGDKTMLPETTVDGVKAKAFLKDTSKAMAAAGMSTTHHFMVSFTDVATGKAMDSGMVAVKVVDPAGKKTEAAPMMEMSGSFGADVALSQKGKYMLEVGTKLGQGGKRQFSFEYLVK